MIDMNVDRLGEPTYQQRCHLHLVILHESMQHHFHHHSLSTRMNMVLVLDEVPLVRPVVDAFELVLPPVVVGMEPVLDGMELVLELVLVLALVVVVELPTMHSHLLPPHISIK